MLNYPVAFLANRTAPISTIIASSVMDLDATISASYPGTGQTWSNLVPAPADGSAKTAYDYFLGASGTPTTDDPTFNGTAGVPSAYWSFDGADYFKIKSGTNTTFLNSLHKTTGGSDWWMACPCRFPALGANISTFFSTRTSGNGLNVGSVTNAGSAYLRLLQASAGSTAVADSSTEAIFTAYATNNLVVISYNNATSTVAWAVNSNTFTTETLTYVVTTTDAVAMLIGATAVPNQMFINGSFMYGFSMGNEYLNNTKLAMIRSFYQRRHARTY